MSLTKALPNTHRSETARQLETPTKSTGKKRIRNIMKYHTLNVEVSVRVFRIKVNQINLIVLEILSRKSHLYFIDNNWNGQNIRQNSNVA